MAKKQQYYGLLTTKGYKFWLTLAVVIFLFAFKFLALVPLAVEGSITLGLLLIIKARKDYITEKPELQDAIYIFGLIAGALVLTAYAFIQAIKSFSYLDMLVLGSLLYAVQWATSFIPEFLKIGDDQLADILGALLAFAVTVGFFGTKGVYVAGLAAFLVLLPGKLPIVSIVFLGLRFLAGVILP